MLDHVRVLVEAEEVEGGRVEGLVVGVDRDNTAFGDHPVHLHVYRPDSSKRTFTAWSPFSSGGECCMYFATIRSSNASASPALNASKRRPTVCLSRSKFAIPLSSQSGTSGS